MRVLSLFDGISCAHLALDRAGVKVRDYLASEIETPCLKVAQHNYPNTQQVGDVRQLKASQVVNADLIIGGSPCQDLSIGNSKRQGLKGSRSGLFWEFVRLRNAIKPTYFVLENVASMKGKDKNTISDALGVQPVMIDAALVSGQTRKRLFWTNIKVQGLPEDKGILLEDVLQPESVAPKFYLREPVRKWKALQYTAFKRTKSYALLRSMYRGAQANGITNVVVKTKCITRDRYYVRDNRDALIRYGAPGLPFNEGCLFTSDANIRFLRADECVRRITPLECERLQGVPDNYTSTLCDTRRYMTLGNAFNVDVVAHILKGIS